MTVCRFGKDLVAPVTTIDCPYGNCRFVTEFIAVELAQNDEPAQIFIGEVSELFAEDGCPVWEVNPHAHANLIRNVDTNVDAYEAELLNTIGPKDVAVLRHATEHAVDAINVWKAADLE